MNKLERTMRSEKSGFEANGANILDIQSNK